MFEIVRYATCSTVAGGFSRLLAKAHRSCPVQRWVAFAIGKHSDGRLYEVTGFRVDGLIRPDYTYLVGNHRELRSEYRPSVP